jgi:hypothetical protein
VLAASNPPLTVWFETGRGQRIERTLSWDNSPTAPRGELWQFTWKP